MAQNPQGLTIPSVTESKNNKEPLPDQREETDETELLEEDGLTSEEAALLEAYENETADQDDAFDAEDDLEEDEEDEAPLPRYDMDSEEKVRLIAATADAVKAEDIAVLDLRQLTIISDFFLICTGKSSIQLRAIASRIEDKLRDIGVRKLRMEGYQEATWILMDYGDVVVHIMAAEQRAFYRLEELWSDAPRLELDLKP